MKRMMRKTILALSILGLVAFAAPRPASANVSFFVGLPGFALFSGPPVVPPVYAPPVYAPPPVVYAPPVYYPRPYPVFYGRPYWGGGWGHGWHRGWYKHGWR
jgi:hypothetical protein